MINIDRPILRQSQDRLGYKVFAHTLARIVREQPLGEGFVIAVDGTWGSGKTSAVFMALEHLKSLERTLPAESRTLAVQFRPWIFSGQHNLVTEFFETLSSKLRRSLGREVADALVGVKDATVRNATALFGGLKLFAAGVGEPSTATAAAVGEKVLKPKARTVEQTLELRMEKLRKALVKAKRKILVVIDDIDRLETNEMQLMLGMLKSVADLPGVVYILPANMSVIHRAITAETGNPDGSFIEKIIQVNLHLPSPSKSGLDNLFSNAIRELSQTADFDEDDLQTSGYYIFNGYIRTPRQVTQLANALSVSWQAMRGEVYFPDLLCLEAIRLFEPQVFEFIRMNGQSILSADSSKGAADRIREKLTTLLRDGENRTSIGLIGQVVPLFGTSTRTTHESGTILGRRMKNDEGFELYFRWSMDPDIVSLSELREFDSALAGSGEPSELVARLARRKSNAGVSASNSLLDAIADKSVSPSHPKRAVAVLLENYKEITVEQNDADFLLSSYRRLESALHRLISTVPPAERKQAVQAALLNPATSIDAGATLLSSFAHEKDSRQILDDTQTRSVASAWVEKRVTREAIRASESPAHIIARVAQLVGKPVKM